MGTLRDKILAARELPRQEVATPEWAPFGVPSVHVRGFTVAEAAEYAELTNGDGPVENMRMATKVCVNFTVDENGERVFTDEDAELLQGMAVSVITRIVVAVNRQSGFGQEENPSMGDQDGQSSSDSPLPSGSLTLTT
jgi:hypothetical protein